MRCSKGGGFQAQETEKTKRRDRKGGGHCYALYDGTAAKARHPLGVDRVVGRSETNIEIAHRPTLDPGDVPVNRPRGRKGLSVLLDRRVIGIRRSGKIARRIVDAG